MARYRNPRTTSRKAAKIRAAYALKRMMDDVARQQAERQEFDPDAAAAVPVLDFSLLRPADPAFLAALDKITPFSGGSL